MRNILKLIFSIAICQVVGIGGAFFTSPAVSSSWYAGLEKPFFQPPSWIFSPVWITLYALMGVAAFLIWSSYAKASEGQAKRKIKIALGIFGLQLFLNAIWSIIFFGLHSPGWALVDIVLLWLAIVWTIAVFYKISKPAAYLLVPYLLWVSFASYLNYSIWMLN